MPEHFFPSHVVEAVDLFMDFISYIILPILAVFLMFILLLIIKGFLGVF